MLTQEQARDLLDAEVVGTGGEKLGRAKKVYLDDETGQPEWVTIQTGLFGTKENFVPLREAQVSAGTVRVPYTKDKVEGSPALEAADERISPDQEAELYRYYGLSYQPWDGPDAGQREALAGSGMTAGRPDEGRGGDEAMTRSEERLDVGTERREAGRARLRKYVVTEQEQQTVPVRRERVRVEREPITESNRDAALSGPEISEAEHEVTLHEERPVVDKTVEPVERVRLTTEEVTGEETVSEPVRKERIETQGEDLQER